MRLRVFGCRARLSADDRGLRLADPTKLYRVAVVLLLALTTALTVVPVAAQQPEAAVIRTPLSVRIDSEGPAGIWSQSVRDLSKAELVELGRLIRASIATNKAVALTDESNPRDQLFLTVVVAQVGSQGHRWITASSAITFVHEKGGVSSLITHDVIIGPDLSSIARSVGYYLATTNFRLIAGIR
jgi:hypothetical protein